VRPRVGVIELGVLAAILGIAALTRLPGLDARGAWDADQGHDMLVLQALVTRGEIPLLGPRTSIGTFHHGAVYYYLLAPSAAVSGADPVAVTFEIALFGIGAVAAVWWLARWLGGPLAAAIAALLAAVSPAGIDESTFIWNPNLIPFAAGVGYAAALHAWHTRHARWWLVAATGAMVTMQCHVLGVVALPPLVVLFVADARRRRSAGEATGRLLWAGLGGLAIIAAGYVPLVINELTHDFAETRAILEYLRGGGGEAAVGFLSRVLIVGVRSVTWPLTGLLTDHLVAALVVTLTVMGLALVAIRSGRRDQRWAATWLVGSIAWSVVALAIFAPSLAVITPGLPNDHYHAFLDPLVLAVVGAGLARLAGLGGALRLGTDRVASPNDGAPGDAAPADGAFDDGAPDDGSPGPGPLGASDLGRLWPAAVGLLAVLIGVAVLGWPPPVSPDGGWALADEAAARTIDAVGGRSFALDGIPPFKSADALRFPLEHRGVVPVAADASSVAGQPAAVVVCDPLFEDVVGLACDGPAEADWQSRAAPGFSLADRIDAGARRVISVYFAPNPSGG
jgi:hypothetical protein